MFHLQIRMQQTRIDRTDDLFMLRQPQMECIWHTNLMHPTNDQLDSVSKPTSIVAII